MELGRRVAKVGYIHLQLPQVEARQQSSSIRRTTLCIESESCENGKKLSAPRTAAVLLYAHAFRPSNTIIGVRAINVISTRYRQASHGTK
jgi:hypothetical protein